MKAKKDLEMARAAAKAKATLEEALDNLPLPKKPTFLSPSGDVEEAPPTLPLRLSELSDDELMRLFVALTRWTDYFSIDMARREVEMTFAKTILDKAEQLVMLRAYQATTPKSDRSTTIAKAEAAADDEVLHWQAEYDMAYARKKFTAVYYEAAERDASAVSRELTRRVGRKESNERRVDRWRP